MGTRANIVIEYGKTRIFLYRHWDGYLASAGADLVEAVNKRQSATELLGALLAEKFDGEDKAVYEITSGIHGDIEYLYRVKYPEYGDGMGWVLIGYAKRYGWDKDLELSAVGLDTMEAFQEKVEPAVAAMKARIAAHEAARAAREA
jgi:hypothetical protein